MLFRSLTDHDLDRESCGTIAPHDSGRAAELEDFEAAVRGRGPAIKPPGSFAGHRSGHQGAIQGVDLPGGGEVETRKRLSALLTEKELKQLPKGWPIKVSLGKNVPCACTDEYEMDRHPLAH